MVKKRKNRGRHKGRGKKGRSGYISCSNCGARIPRDKAIRRVVWRSYVDPQLSQELKKQGAIILKQPLVKYYCVSCAIHFGVVRIGMSAERKAREG
jgi:small subunit ribosomal protein S26e